MSFLYLIMVLLFGIFVPITGSTLQKCPSHCSCDTYALPTASAFPNKLWASVLASASFTNVSSSTSHLSPPTATTTHTNTSKRNFTAFDVLLNSLIRFEDNINEIAIERQSEEKDDFLNSSSSSSPITPTFSTPLFLNQLRVFPGEVLVSCSNNELKELPFANFTNTASIVKLDLSDNLLETFPTSSLWLMHNLRFLILDRNRLSSVNSSSLPPSLVHLSLGGNLLSHVPPKLGNVLHKLYILNLAHNQIQFLKSTTFIALPRMLLLSLHRNRIQDIEDDAFRDIPNLRVLDLSNNLLLEVPRAVLKAKALIQILLGNNQITYVREDAFYGLNELQWVDLQGNPLLAAHPRSFVRLPALRKLILESARQVSEFPELNGTSSLEVLRIDRAALTKVPYTLCQTTPELKSLNLHLNQISELPDLILCSKLKLLDLSNNQISDLPSKSFIGVPLLHDLLLQYNHIQVIPENAFQDLKHLQILNLEYNRISTIHPKAFIPLVKLEDLNLGNNLFSELPSVGLEHVVSLKAHNNPHLRLFPGPQSFPAVHSLVLSYAYHCCPFISDSNVEGAGKPSLKFTENVVYNVDQIQRMSPEIWNHSHVWPHLEGVPTSEMESVWATSQRNLSTIPPITTQTTTTSASTSPQRSPYGHGSLQPTSKAKLPDHFVYCIPQPGPFMPCRDLFDWWTLRCGVWLVFLLALMGNGVVVVVLVSAYSKMDVPRFLVSNLALADFFMGVYLGFLAVVDASTLGEFRVYAIPWQMSAGCQLAGFLGVFSSELSVYTLTVITMERNYAITHAMHLNKRLSLKHAAYIMTVGWLFALTMAILPLTGVSDYRKFAVCLPFETDGAGLGYVVFLMFINGVAFLMLMGCYLKIYCAIRGSQAWNSNDSKIAKRMALLVFTDFICWAPIAFFSLSAAFGLQLISLEEAKVFTVFLLPLNSCCNPFLYALLTKQFKKDCVMLCKAIEESRVTRGIGRCRHSSNFSNRQTPANTNSALNETSKEEGSCHCGFKNHPPKGRATVTARALRLLCCHSDLSGCNVKSKASTVQVRRSPLRVVRAATLGSGKTDSSTWSWRGQSASTSKLLELRREATLDLTRKSSQESSLSSSRNDSSGTSNSTMTWRISRSSVSSDASSGGTKGGAKAGSFRDKDKKKEDGNGIARAPFAPLKPSGLTTTPPCKGAIAAKPRLQRQRAFEREPTLCGPSSAETSQLRCPLHPRKDNLSCVYEQDSLEEEEGSSDVFVSASPFCLAHRRSLSDGLLCGTLLSLSAPTPQLVPALASTKGTTSKDSTTKDTSKGQLPITFPSETDASSSALDEGISDSVNDSTTETKPEGLLETHFPMEEEQHEADPLLQKK